MDEGVEERRLFWENIIHAIFHHLHRSTEASNTNYRDYMVWVSSATLNEWHIMQIQCRVVW